MNDHSGRAINFIENDSLGVARGTCSISLCFSHYSLVLLYCILGTLLIVSVVKTIPKQICQEHFANMQSFRDARILSVCESCLGELLSAMDVEI